MERDAKEMRNRCLEVSISAKTPPLDTPSRIGNDRNMKAEPKTNCYSVPAAETLAPMDGGIAYSSNDASASAVLAAIASRPSAIVRHLIAGAEVFDFGISPSSSLELGLLLTRVCTGDLLHPSIVPCDANLLGSPNAVFVRTDDPLVACIGCQYAGWPVQTDDYFAMGSGPMRMLRGQEPVLKKLQLVDNPVDRVCGVLESDTLPTASAIERIASDCERPVEQLLICVAPSTCIAGSVQVVARSVETAMHKLHELGFDIRQVVSGTGTAPLPPPAKRSRTMTGIGRTNDAMLYGAHVTLWVSTEDSEIDSIIDQVPSSGSPAHGKPFEKIFADHDNDFYAVDPNLFSPAVVTIHNLRSGKTFSAGRIMTDVLLDSFGT